MSIQGSGKSSESEDITLEIKRQAFHLVALLLWLVPVLYFPFWLALLTFLAVLGTNLAVVKRVEPFYGFFRVFIDHLERDSNLNRPSLQALYANAGIFISYLFFGELSTVGIVVLAVGDSLSTLVGKLLGTTPLFNSARKTAEGSGAFFLSVYIVLLMILQNNREAVLVSSLSTLIESFDLKVDDNLILPIVATAIAYLV